MIRRQKILLWVSIFCSVGLILGLYLSNWNVRLVWQVIRLPKDYSALNNTEKIGFWVTIAGTFLTAFFGMISVYNPTKKFSKKLDGIDDKLGRIDKRLQDGQGEQKKGESEQRIYTAKLPVTGRGLFGREKQLKILDEAWGGERTKIISFVAWGGVGKTALVNEWLNRMGEKDWQGAQRVYGWSFYSQGTTEDRQASSDTFLANALERFGDKETAESAKSAWDKGVRLAELVREQKTLLILDGVEPLQYPPGPMKGRLKDQGLQALLRELSRGMNGLCVITTRERIKDIQGQVGHSVKLVELENLSPEAGMQVLRATGVKGTDKELIQASEEFGGHALALTLLGNYLAVVHNGEIRKKDLIPALMDEEEQGGHAKRVMESYEIWLKRENKAELDILYLMGLFDRPAEKDAIDALRAKPIIKGLTDNLAGLSEAKWKYAVEHLRELHLLAKEEENWPDDLDCHPLVREHFEEKLKKDKPEAWREAHSRLYEYYKSVPKKELPDTLEEMEPLFQAVYHGCQANRYNKAIKLYLDRIQRGNEFYCISKISAYSAVLAALSGFFKTPWTQLYDVIADMNKSSILGISGFCLRAVGRLHEAWEAMECSLKMEISMKDWRNAADSAGNLSDVLLMLGHLQKAVAYGSQGVELAELSGSSIYQERAISILAHALHQMGELEAAETQFRGAEAIQKREHPSQIFLCSVRGFWFCDLLLERKRFKEVQERVNKAIKLPTLESWALDTALAKLLLGRAAVFQVEVDKTGNLQEAEDWLNQAVQELVNIGEKVCLAGSLFARAGLYRVQRDYENAWMDLEEAREIAERGEMKLFLADYHLESSRVCLDEENKDDAKGHYEEAKRLIEECGYHKRDRELEEIKGKLGN